MSLSHDSATALPPARADAPDPPVNQFNGFTTYLRRPRARATPPRLGGNPPAPGPRCWRAKIRGSGGLVLMADGGAMPRSLDPHVRCQTRMGRSGRAITCNLSLSTILFARAT